MPCQGEIWKQDNPGKKSSVNAQQAAAFKCINDIIDSGGFDTRELIKHVLASRSIGAMDFVKDFLDSYGIDTRDITAVLNSDASGRLQTPTTDAVNSSPHNHEMYLKHQDATDKIIHEPASAFSKDLFTATVAPIVKKRPNMLPGILPTNTVTAPLHASPQPGRLKTLQPRLRSSTRPRIQTIEPLNARAEPDMVCVPGGSGTRKGGSAISFRIGDSKRVEEFLEDRLRRMQQLANKRIAKCWIKGICPKKQAKFPYQKQKRSTQAGRPPTLPGWWPDLSSTCRFIEPDHIKRDERVRLCVHLLRLRPSIAQLNEWNGDALDRRKADSAWPKGWTGFLQDFAGDEIFDDLPTEPNERTLQRRELLHQMYEVADMEERMINGEIDTDEVYHYFDNEHERRRLPKKRVREPSNASGFGADADSHDSHRVSAKKARTQAKLHDSRLISAVDVEPTLVASPTCDQAKTPSRTFDRHMVDLAAVSQRTVDQGTIKEHALCYGGTRSGHDSNNGITIVQNGLKWCTTEHWAQQASNSNRTTTTSSFDGRFEYPHEFAMSMPSISDSEEHEVHRRQTGCSGIVDLDRAPHLPEAQFQESPMLLTFPETNGAPVLLNSVMSTMHNAHHNPAHPNSVLTAQYWNPSQQEFSAASPHLLLPLTRHIYQEDPELQQDSKPEPFQHHNLPTEYSRGGYQQ